MRLKKLTIQAFEPFKNKVIIDFEEQGIDKGLLLITGDTGARKTSIFDAICFALFGKASGEDRQTYSLRSQFAGTEEETFVELEFYHKGKLYIVKRTPEYERVKKKGYGTIKQPPTAEFEIDGRKITKYTDVTKEIENLIGLNYNQFSKLVMLPQGEFSKFLIASSDEKTEIFRRIFDTGIYNSIMIKLKNEAKIRETNCENLRYNINKEREKLSEQDEYGKYCGLNIEELLETLEKKIEVDSKELAEIKEKKDKLNDEKNKKQIIYDKATELNKKIQEYTDVSNKLSKLLKESDDIEKDREIAKYNKTVAVKITSIVNDIEIYQKHLKENVKQLKIAHESKKESDAKFEENKENFKKLEIFSSQIDNVNSNIKKFGEYIKKLSDYKDYNKKLLEEKKKYKMSFEKQQSERIKLEEMKSTYYLNSAFLIATQLEENKPCPVCGSIEHPHLAEKSEKEYTKKEIENQEKLERKLDNETKKIETKIESIKENIIKLELRPDINCDDELEKTEESLTKANEEKDNLVKENIELSKLKEELNAKKTKAETNIKIYEKQKEENIKNIEMLKQDLESTLEKNSTTLEEYNLKKINTDKLEDLENKIANFDKNKTTYETTIKTLELDVKDKKIENLDDKKAEIDKITAEYSTLDSKYYNNHELIVKTIQIKKNIEEYNKEYELESKEYSIICTLSSTANATLSGVQKITFENYVQSIYMENVIVEANKRLLKMTDGRYELRRKEFARNLKEKSGLDFTVYDANTGKERDVSTFSGGEKFKASLALALGLSDVISMYAGGIKTDCLFVDEGFGSLDPESLNQAINILTDLVDTDKLVGIISHVEELESRIDKKIRVIKTKEGSKINIEG